MTPPREADVWRDIPPRILAAARDRILRGEPATGTEPGGQVAWATARRAQPLTNTGDSNG